MSAILRISDGTTTISLINEGNVYGFHLTSWRPQIPFFKNGGTFQQSSLSDGRRLVDSKYDTFIESLTVSISGESQDELITRLQDLRRLFSKAAAFWTTDYQNEPVWIEAKANDETNSRYALISTGHIPEDKNPYAQPFLQPTCNALESSVNIIIEHLFWTEEEPQTQSGTAISAIEEFDSTDYGNVNFASGNRITTTDRDVYLANKRNVANISHIFLFDGGWSGNLIASGPPHYVIDNAIAVGDIGYYGIQTTIADSGPFSSLVFNISPGGTGYSATWEYYNGAWVALTVRDHTLAIAGTPFGNTGVNSVNWVQPSDWIPVAVNGVTGYWVRVRVTAAPGATTEPQQRTELVYSVVWPYIEIQTDVVGGDIEALGRYLLESVGYVPGGLGGYRRTIMSSRTWDRGNDFTPFINYADEQNPADFVVGAVGGTFQTNTETPSGREVRHILAFATTTTSVSTTLGDTVLPQYTGKYRVFIRAKSDNATPKDDFVQLAFYYNAFFLYEVTTRFGSPTDWEVLDMGVLTIPAFPGEQGNVYTIYTLCGTDDAAGTTLHLYDLILIPIDEWALESIPQVFSSASSIAQNSQMVDMDSIRWRKRQVSIVKRFVPSNRIGYIYVPVGERALIQTAAKQRMYFFGMDRDNANGVWISYPSTGNRVQVWRQQQYFSMRGNR